MGGDVEAGGSVVELVDFAAALARRLSELRTAAGLSPSQACAAARVTMEELTAFEAGVWKPSVPKLVRFAELYRVSLEVLLLGPAKESRRTLGGRFDPLAEAMMLLAGVTPEQFDGEALRSVDCDGSAASEVLWSKDNSPARLQSAMALRAAYEAGKSIRELAEAEGVSFGTARNLLIEAGATLRGQGGPRPRRSS